MIITTTDRNQLRLKVLEVATNIFLRDGADAVRMDDLAQSLSVSKRTLYEVFGSKEELLIQCLNSHLDNMSEIIENEIRREDDVLTVFLKYLKILIDESLSSGHKSPPDLEKYPELKKIFISHMQKMGLRMRGFMQLGVKQGVFRDDLNMDVVMMAFSAMGKATHDEAHKGIFIYDQLINGTMMLLLRGIATQKGLEKLDKYRYNYKDKE